jgi:hypothetical protein
MFHRTLKHLPGRRLELGLTTLLLAGLAVIIGRNRDGGPGLTLLTLELLLPLGAAIVAAGLLAEDPALDLLLSVPQPAPRTLVHRVGTILAWSALLGLSLQGWAWGWAIPLPIHGALQVLIWLTPTVLYTGLATAGALLRGRMLDGVAAAFGVWAASVFTLPALRDACSTAPATGCLAALASPALTQLLPGDPYWLLNRALWLGLGSLLLSGGLWLAHNEERLLTAVGTE